MKLNFEVKWREDAEYGDGWWLINHHPNIMIPDTGPYDTKRECEEARQGRLRFLRENLDFFLKAD